MRISDWSSDVCSSDLLLMTNLPAAAQAPTPPDVARKAHVVETPFGATRDDDYYWLRDDDRKDKAMLVYLEAENAYTEAVMAPIKPLQDRLYEEIVARIKKDDSSVPVREHGDRKSKRMHYSN